MFIVFYIYVQKQRFCNGHNIKKASVFSIRFKVLSMSLPAHIYIDISAVACKSGPTPSTSPLFDIKTTTVPVNVF